MKGWIFATALLVLGSVAQPAQAFSERELETQLTLLKSWWQGHFDNHEQIVRQSGGGLAKPVYEPVFRLHAIYKPIDLPALGEHVIYVEEYKNNDPTDLYRIRLYSLRTDVASGTIRITMHAPLDQAKWQGAHADPDRLAQITTDEVRAFSENCEAYVAYEGGQFRGGMQDRKCQIENSYFDYDIVIGENHYWFRDERRDVDTNEVVWELTPGSNFQYLQLTKARWFTCTVNYNLDGDMTATEYLTTIDVHDQGGEAPITYPDGKEYYFTIHDRAFATPTDRTFPLFRIHNKDNHVPIAYAYAVDDADRFGLNLGWFYTLCRLTEQGAPRP